MGVGPGGDYRYRSRPRTCRVGGGPGGDYRYIDLDLDDVEWVEVLVKTIDI